MKVLYQYPVWNVSQTMNESTVEVYLNVRVSIKTDRDPINYTVKEWKTLLAKKIRQTIKDKTIEEIYQGIRKYDIISQEESCQ